MTGRNLAAVTAVLLAASLPLALPAESSEPGVGKSGIKDHDSVLNQPPESTASSLEFRLIDGKMFKSATPRVYKAPQYPRRMAELGGEGWVLLSFVVTRDGTVRDPVVLDSSRREFERPALDSVRSFEYEPAEVDGQPVSSILPMFLITFALEPPSDGARPEFVQRFRRLQRSLDRGDLDGAAKALELLDTQGALNLYEDAYLWWARAMLHRAHGNLRGWRESMLRAVAYAGPGRPGGLPAETHKTALELLYGDYTRTGELAAALGIFDQLSTLVGPGKESPELQAHVETVRNTLAGDGMLRAEGYIAGDRPWPQTLWRDGFEFADIVGRLEKLSLWCENRALELEIDPESSWQIPASWGACQLYVRGEPGTSFSLLEYSSAAEAPASN